MTQVVLAQVVATDMRRRRRHVIGFRDRDPGFGLPGRGGLAARWRRNRDGHAAPLRRPAPAEQGEYVEEACHARSKIRIGHLATRHLATRLLATGLGAPEAP
jgi:hypothetical protein